MTRVSLLLRVVVVVLVTLVGSSCGEEVEQEFPKEDQSYVNPWHQRIMPREVHLQLGANPDEVVILWRTIAGDIPSVVQYTTHKTKQYVVVTSDKEQPTPMRQGEGYLHMVILRGLRPNEKYYYCVGHDNAWSNWFSFTLRKFPMASEDKVTLISFGDVGVRYDNSLAVYSLLQRRIFSGHPVDFVLHNGDLAYGFGNETVWNEFFHRMQGIGAYVPYIVSRGNRDEPDVIMDRFRLPKDENSFLKAFNKDNFYYSFDYGHAHIVVLDTNEDYTPDSEQYHWLVEDLKTARKKINRFRSHLQWIILFGHSPMYSSSNGHTGGNIGLRLAIEPLLVEYGVSLCVWADDHVYERTYPMDRYHFDEHHFGDWDIHLFVNPDKPIHAIVGTGGIDLDGWQEGDQPRWSAKRLLVHGYLNITITKQDLVATFWRASDGELVDVFAIRHLPKGDISSAGPHHPAALMSTAVFIVWSSTPVTVGFVLVVLCALLRTTRRDPFCCPFLFWRYQHTAEDDD